MQFWEELLEGDVMPSFDPRRSQTNDVVRQGIIPRSRVGNGGFALASIWESPVLPQSMVTSRPESFSYLRLERSKSKLPIKSLVTYLYNSPNSLLWGSLLGKKRLAAICSGRVPGACPPCVRLVSATCPPCWLWPRLHSLSATCSLLVRRLSALCPMCCWLWPRLQALSATCPFCVRHLSALCIGFGRAFSPCPPLVRLVSATCPLYVRLVFPYRPLVRQVSAYNVRLYSVWICVPLCPPLSGSICM